MRQLIPCPFQFFHLSQSELIWNKSDFEVYAKHYQAYLILVSIGPLWHLMVNLISRFVDFSGFWEVAQEFKVEKYFRYINVLYRLKQFCPRMTSRTSCWRHKLSIILPFVCADKRL